MLVVFKRHRALDPIGSSFCSRLGFALATFFYVIIVLGLIIDNMRLFVSTYVGFGKAVMDLSYIGFFVHKMLVPGSLICLSEVAHIPNEGLHSSGGWIAYGKCRSVANRGLFRGLALFGTAIFMIVGGFALASALEGHLDEVDRHGVKYYAHANPSDAEKSLDFVPLIIFSIFGVLVGVCVWRRFGYWWLLVAQALVLICKCVRVDDFAFFSSPILDIIYLGSMIWSEKRIIDITNNRRQESFRRSVRTFLDTHPHKVTAGGPAPSKRNEPSAVHFDGYGTLEADRSALVGSKRGARDSNFYQ